MEPANLIAGLHSVRIALKAGAGSVQEVWVESRRQDHRIRELIDLAKQQGVKLRQVSREELDRLVPGSKHQGVVARTRVSSARDEAFLKTLLREQDEPAGALEDLRLLRNLDDVGVLRDRPEGRVARRLQLVDRRLVAKPRPDVVRIPALGVDVRRDGIELVERCVGDAHGSLFEAQPAATGSRPR